MEHEPRTPDGIIMLQKETYLLYKFLRIYTLKTGNSLTCFSFLIADMEPHFLISVGSTWSGYFTSPLSILRVENTAVCKTESYENSSKRVKSSDV